MDFFTGRGAKFYEFSVKLMELMWLNVLVVITSLPIFTIGASFSAMHTVLVKIYRDEEDQLTRTFFSAFKKNFKQATLIWLIYLGVYGILLLDDYAMRLLDNPSLKYLDILVPVLAFITTLSLCWVFVLQSRYKLTIKDTIVFSFTRIIAFPIRTLFMAFTLIVPLLFAWYLEGLLILVFIMGITVPGILSTCFYNHALNVMEDDSEKVQENAEEEVSTDEEDSNFAEESEEETVE
ncbi:MAG: DUF624 domain-containing protein [Ruminococcaceae bacterium]|nr:DUF624 domain-containing protein [Oscillospiraceae bacterium]